MPRLLRTDILRSDTLTISPRKRGSQRHPPSLGRRRRRVGRCCRPRSRGSRNEGGQTGGEHPDVMLHAPWT